MPINDYDSRFQGSEAMERLSKSQGLWWAMQATGPADIDWSQPGGMIHLAPGERVEIQPFGIYANRPTLCPYCGNATATVADRERHRDYGCGATV